MKRNTLRNLAMSAILAGGILIAGAGSNVYANGWMTVGGRSSDIGGSAVQSTGDNGTIVLGGGRSDNNGGGLLGSGNNYSATENGDLEVLFGSVLEFFFN